MSRRSSLTSSAYQQALEVIASVEPRIAGVPFFYWYQFLWVAIGAALTAVVYFVTVPRDREPGA